MTKNAADKWEDEWKESNAMMSKVKARVGCGERQHRRKKQQVLMGETPIQSYRDLRVWQEAMNDEGDEEEVLRAMLLHPQQAAVSTFSLAAQIPFAKQTRMQSLPFFNRQSYEQAYCPAMR